MKRFKNTSKRWKVVILIFTILLAFVALVLINNIVVQIQNSEKEKIKLWVNAISRKAELVSHTETFFKTVREEERNRMTLLTEAQQAFMELPLDQDVSFYYNYLSANKTIPVIITDDQNNITWYRNIELPNGVTKLEGGLLREFSQESPVHYTAYNMHFTLYYKESKIYTDLRKVLDDFSQSFLSEITNNSVFVPVIVTDSMHKTIIASGNINTEELSSTYELRKKLANMAEDNSPIEIILPDDCKAYIYYEKTPLLQALQYAPIIYIFIAFVLILVSYNLFRTARDMEQNQVWVGMAKETAHQLGTPISSLIAWLEYFKEKGLEEKYSVEIQKDLTRLETITHRFSKIGSVPELKDENILGIIKNAVNYLQSRTSKKITFVTNFPETAHNIIVPLNAYLFEWVIENVCKNAIDAMNGVGTFTIIVTEDEKYVYIDLCDTGKGMPSSMYKDIFKPGYSTKQRGWGLGLSLAKRIINDYHKGKIFVKYSVIDQGTVFRIILNKKKMVL
ncbi:MAG: HAMP domain-containing histidine kinase [Bacteroidales bacterium]|nr:HAMP domain-containing histidine kinase [Bacteroidales bacterium]